MPWRALLAVALLPAALAGCAGEEPLPPEWKGRDLDAPGWANATVQPGWTLALEYVWPSGKLVEWDWLSNGTSPVYFQVVRMEGGQARPLVARHSDQDRGELTVPIAGPHQVLFQNEMPWPATVWHRLPEGAGVRSHPPGQGPACLLPC